MLEDQEKLTPLVDTMFLQAGLWQLKPMTIIKLARDMPKLGNQRNTKSVQYSLMILVF